MGFIYEILAACASLVDAAKHDTCDKCHSNAPRVSYEVEECGTCPDCLRRDMVIFSWEVSILQKRVLDEPQSEEALAFRDFLKNIWFAQRPQLYAMDRIATVWSELRKKELISSTDSVEVKAKKEAYNKKLTVGFNADQTLEALATWIAGYYSGRSYRFSWKRVLVERPPPQKGKAPKKKEDDDEKEEEEKEALEGQPSVDVEVERKGTPPKYEDFDFSAPLFLPCGEEADNVKLKDVVHKILSVHKGAVKNDENPEKAQSPDVALEAIKGKVGVTFPRQFTGRYLACGEKVPGYLDLILTRSSHCQGKNVMKRTIVPGRCQVHRVCQLDNEEPSLGRTAMTVDNSVSLSYGMNTNLRNSLTSKAPMLGGHYLFGLKSAVISAAARETFPLLFKWMGASAVKVTASLQQIPANLLAIILGVYGEVAKVPQWVIDGMVGKTTVSETIDVLSKREGDHQKVVEKEQKKEKKEPPIHLPEAVIAMDPAMKVMYDLVKKMESRLDKLSGGKEEKKEKKKDENPSQPKNKGKGKKGTKRIPTKIWVTMSKEAQEEHRRKVKEAKGEKEGKEEKEEKKDSSQNKKSSSSKKKPETDSEGFTQVKGKEKKEKKEEKEEKKPSRARPSTEELEGPPQRIYLDKDLEPKRKIIEKNLGTSDFRVAMRKVKEALPDSPKMNIGRLGLSYFTKGKFDPKGKESDWFLDSDHGFVKGAKKSD